ncbi:beta strand repeat-containing protein [Rubinisphaera margarita]|uniref:beta strand repeat-containing protein n=1 Tax=Rubinisphaera margarita TaxID=2909586 RepID=UPI001EE91F6C|nr:right-handed parallel beta-helix repeat-containing protein [Rubinisphaera margarita]MCG6155926.1 hypothetical protein [Rubinisphaera margarita]
MNLFSRIAGRRIDRIVRRRRAHKSCQYSSEALECRTMLTAYVVDTPLDVVAADGMISLREAILAANSNVAVFDAPAGTAVGDSISFDSGLAGSTISLTGEIDISEDLTITGTTPSITLDAGGISRVFDISTADNVSLSNLTLTQGSADTGGAIRVTGGGMLSLNNLVFQANTATGAGGGAIHNIGSDVVITGGSFTGNIASGASGSGGAINNDSGGTLDITGTSFSSNLAVRAGGAIEDNSGGGITIDQSSFTSNDAAVTLVGGPGNGGAIHMTGSGNVTITDSTFMMNEAANEGGALWNGTGRMIVVDSTIGQNEAHGTGPLNGGGGIFNLGGRLALTRTDVSMNVADGTTASGGGILSLNGFTSIADGAVTGNVSNRTGGGIQVEAGRLTLDGVNLDNNIAGPLDLSTPGTGGGLFVGGATTVRIDGGTVTGNAAVTEGAGLWFHALASSTINGTVISSNTASGDLLNDGGGGIYTNGGTLNVLNATISGNTSDGLSGSGGGIFSAAGRVNISNTSIVGNQANRAGGGIEVVDGTVRLTNVNLDGNSAGLPGVPNPGNGGGLHITGSSNTVVRLDGGTVMNNTASLEGGGLWNQMGSTLTVNGSTVSGNVALGAGADDGGGAIFNNGGTVNVLNALVSANLATGASGSGGAILSTAGRVNVSNTSIVDNQANRAGGGIEVIDGRITLTNVNLDSNDAGLPGVAAPGNGGGLHVTGTAGTLVRVNGGTVSNNTAVSEGGGLWNQSGSILRVNGTVLANNTASGNGADDGGGAIFNNGGLTVVTGATLTGNVANGTSGSGGAAFSTDGTLTFNGNTMINSNVANRAGGGVEVVDGRLNILGSTLSNNIAGPIGFASPGNGGGVHISGVAGTEVLIDNSNILNNTAANEGGGIWNQTNAVMDIFNTNVHDNNAFGELTINGGGGLFNNNGGIIDIVNSSFRRNDAFNGSRGGGLSLSTGGVVSIDGGEAVDNITNGLGGGFYNDGYLRIFGNMDVIDNIALNGGGIYTDGNGLTDLANANIFSNDPNNLAGPGTVD